MLNCRRMESRLRSCGLRLAIAFQLKSTEVARTPQPAVWHFPKALAGELLPAKTARQQYTIQRQETRRQLQLGETQVRLVDGSRMQLGDQNPRRLRMQPKQEEKLEMQAQIKRLRTQERIYSALITIFAQDKLRVPLLRRPFWRLSRVVPNSDMRSYICYWVIDNEADCVRFKDACHAALKESENLVRYQLGLQLASKFTPSIKFHYEDYREHQAVAPITR